MKTGEKIAKLRRERNISQEALADMLGLSRQSVSKWENGSALPAMDNLSRLAGIFGVPLSYLLDDGRRQDRPSKQPLNTEPEQKATADHASKKRAAGPVYAVILLAVCCMAFWFFDRRLNSDMQNRLDRISRLESEISSLRGQISGISRPQFPSYSRDFADMSYKLLDYDTLTNTAEIQFTAVPASYTDSTVFRVSVGGQETVTADGEYSGGMFTAVVKAVCSDYMPVYFYLVDGQETRTYSFGSLEDPSLAYVMKIKEFTFDGYISQSQKGKLYISGQVRATLSIPVYTGDQDTLLKKVKQATLTLTYGDKVIYKDNFEAILDESTKFETSFTEEDTKAAYASGRLGNAEITYFHYLPENINADVPSGAQLILTLNMTDADGQKYRAQTRITVK